MYLQSNMHLLLKSNNCQVSLHLLKSGYQEFTFTLNKSLKFSHFLFSGTSWRISLHLCKNITRRCFKCLSIMILRSSLNFSLLNYVLHYMLFLFNMMFKFLQLKEKLLWYEPWSVNYNINFQSQEITRGLGIYSST